MLCTIDPHFQGSARHCKPHLTMAPLPISQGSYSLLASRGTWRPALIRRQRIIITASLGDNGSNNRLGPSKQRSSSSPAPIVSRPSRSSRLETNKVFDPLSPSFNEFIGKSMYKYYNWRQDTLSDLQLFTVINAVVIALGAALKQYLAPSSISSAAGDDAPLASQPSELGIDSVNVPPSWWQDLYSVLVVVLGQELPEGEASSFSQQLFAVATAFLGLASFALVLALIEQATLELLENNVRRGSKVYEKDHYVILTYGESARDLSQCKTITEQICVASAATGGAVIVILVAHREKLEMETLFREALPMDARCRSQIVFRQGSPLDPSALKMVGVTDARAVILSGDYSRSVEDSDAQVLRCAVLIDEMTAAAGKEWIDKASTFSSTASFHGEKGGVAASDAARGDEHNFTSHQTSVSSSFGTTNGMGPWVVVEVQGSNVPALLRYACTSRVIPVPSSTINARRYAQLLKHPAVATLSHALFDHYSRSNCLIGYYPEATWLLGQKFGDIHGFFPDAIVVGVVDIATWKAELSCDPNRVLKKGEALVMLRPSMTNSYTVRPLRHAVPAALDLGGNWDPNLYSLRSVDDAPLGKDASGERVRSWNRTDTSSTASVSTCDISTKSAGNGSGGTVFGIGEVLPHAPPPRGPSGSVDIDGDDDDTSTSESGTMEVRGQRRNGGQSRQSRRLGAALLPLSYGSASSDGGNSNGIGSDLLICGWPGSTAMVELLKELDHGVEALPQGSRVILLNNHSWERVSAKCSLNTLIQRLDIKHVKCDPRDRQALSAALDVTTLRAAFILHDTHWGITAIGGDGNVGGSTSYLLQSNDPTTASSPSPPSSSSPYRVAAESSAYSFSQADMLRMDAAVLEVQLNVRYLLETACCPDINILSEKLTYLGQTRFENRNELPIGAAVNSASFAAKVLAQTALQPRALFAYSAVGVQCKVVVQDTAAFAKEGEELSFFNLQARCATVSQVIMGYYDVPSSIDEVLNIMVNPDSEDRMVKRVWNAGNSRCKLITLAPRASLAKALKVPAAAAAGDEKPAEVT